MTLRNLISLAFAALGCLAANVQAAPPLSNVTSVSVQNRTCVLTNTGGVKCWGVNGLGELGDGSTLDRPTPVDVIGLTSGATAASVSLTHGCALDSSGGLKCWGSASQGQLGNGTTTPAVQLATPVSGLASGVTSFGLGDMHTCAALTTGGMKCWGWNATGQLGNGTVSGPAAANPLPLDVVGISANVVAIAAASFHTCALLVGGHMQCWGQGAFGQLGDGTLSDHHTPADVPSLTSGVIAIAASGQSTCALTSSGGVKCWGDNSTGVLGDGTTTMRSVPTDVVGLSSGVTAISMGFSHACALLSGGAMKCWGLDTHGELGHPGAGNGSFVPVDVVGLPGPVTAMSAGSVSTCAVSGGQVYCWGSNFNGALGIGTFGGDTETPTLVVVLALQTISFASPGNHDIAEGAIGVAPFASSGLAVTVTSQTPSVCTASGTTITLVAIGICTLAADQPGNADFLAAQQVVQRFYISGNPPATAPRLSGLSTRMQVLTGDDVLIGGFIIGGSVAKTVVVRARGQSLANSGITGTLPDPLLRIVSSQSIATNDSWAQDPSAPLLQVTGLQPTIPNEAAILATLQPGAYTAIVSGGGTGVGMFEVYEVDHAEVPLVGISTRGRVLTGDNVMIAGFIVSGTSPQKVIVRARGPSLSAQGVASPLANPTLQLFSAAGLVTTNDDWGTASNAAQVTSSGFAPSDPLESAILITLPPGAYTAVVSGVGGTTGVGLVEVYLVP